MAVALGTGLCKAAVCPSHAVCINRPVYVHRNALPFFNGAAAACAFFGSARRQATTCGGGGTGVQLHRTPGPYREPCLCP